MRRGGGRDCCRSAETALIMQLPPQNVLLRTGKNERTHVAASIKTRLELISECASPRLNGRGYDTYSAECSLSFALIRG